MTSQHTPGPWYVTPDACAVYEKDGLGYRADTICHIVGHPFTRANARLIAAAPDMLAALERAADELDSIMDWHGIGHPAVLRDARAAIAKARGE